MRRSDDNPPSCRYYVNQPCERPMKCPVHRPIAVRPQKPHHVLQAESLELAKAEAPLVFSTWLKTLCGMNLHQRIDLDAEIAALSPVSDQHGLRRHSEVTNHPYFYHPPKASEDPNYEVYRWVGSDREVLVADVPTCKSCLRSYKP